VNMERPITVLEAVRSVRAAVFQMEQQPRRALTAEQGTAIP
jgi:hypothetical protein